MRYWDSSALLPLVVREAVSGRVEELLEEDASVVTWWGSSVECASGIARREREGLVKAEDVAILATRLRTAAGTWAEVPATLLVRDQATRLVRLHPLRAGDAFHLAAAIVASDFQPSTLHLVTLDRRLAAAADREGFTVIA